MMSFRLAKANLKSYLKTKQNKNLPGLLFNVRVPLPEVIRNKHFQDALSSGLHACGTRPSMHAAFAVCSVCPSEKRYTEPGSWSFAEKASCEQHILKLKSVWKLFFGEK